jgi:hypothetical protein
LYLSAVSSSLGVSESYISLTGEEKEIIIDTKKAAEAGEKISVEGTTIRFDKGPVTITVVTTEPPKLEEGKLTGKIDSISMASKPLNARYPQKGIVTASFRSNLNNLPPEGASVSAVLLEKLDAGTLAVFERAAAEQGYRQEAVAYAMQVRKSGIYDRTDIGESEVTMTVAPAWILSHGGITNAKIARLADDGSCQLLASRFAGLDSTENMVFTGTSPGGLSIFALVSVQSQPAVIQSQASPVSEVPAGFSSPLVFAPPIFLFTALFLYRKP